MVLPIEKADGGDKRDLSGGPVIDSVIERPDAA
jgi:hypothetical protein